MARRKIFSWQGTPGGRGVLRCYQVGQHAEVITCTHAADRPVENDVAAQDLQRGSVVGFPTMPMTVHLIEGDSGGR